MNSLQNKAVSALQIFVSKYSLLLFVMFLGVDNAKAQQSSQNRIIGYWKGEFQTVYNGFDMTVITYDAVFADGSAKSVALGVGNGNKTTMTATYKYWFEKNYYCTQMTGKAEISKSSLEWLSENEGYQTWVNGESKGVKAHYIRVEKDEFEKYFNNSVLLLDIPIPQSTNNGKLSGFNNTIIGYWKFDSQFTLPSSGSHVTIIGYKYIKAEGRFQEIILQSINNNPKIYNSEFKYWFEGKYYCTPKTGKYDVSRCTLDFLNENELYAEYVSGIREGSTEHYTRVTKEEFEKYLEHPSLLYKISPSAPPSHPGTTTPDKICPSCHGQCENDCASCGGRGQLKKTVQKQVWDYYDKKYKYKDEEVWENCLYCNHGKVKCYYSLCPCNKR